MPLELLRWPQSDSLANNGKAISGAAVGEALTAVGNKERLGRRAEKSVPFPGVIGKLHSRAVRNRQQAGLAEFSLAECYHSVLQIDIAGIERKSLANPEAGDGNQSEQCGTRQSADAIN